MHLLKTHTLAWTLAAAVGLTSWSAFAGSPATQPAAATVVAQPTNQAPVATAAQPVVQVVVQPAGEPVAQPTPEPAAPVAAPLPAAVAVDNTAEPDSIPALPGGSAIAETNAATTMNSVQPAAPVAVATAATVAAPAPTAAPVTVTFAQTPGAIPQPPVENRGLAPSRAHLWVPGYYGWNGNSYIWVAGRWDVPPSPRYHQYEAAHWQLRGRRHRMYVFVPARWRR